MRILLPVFVVAALLGAPAAVRGQAQTPAGGADELSRQATDPTASLMAFNFINDVRASFTDSDDAGFEFRFQPVVPFRAFKTANILRVVIPYQGSGPGNEGLKDVSIFDLVVLPQKWGRLGIGPVMNLKQSSGNAPSKFAIGPAVGGTGALSKKLTIGLFSQNLFASDVADLPEVSSSKVVFTVTMLAPAK